MKKLFSRSSGMAKAAMGLVALALFLPGPAHAEIKAGSVELSPFVGYNVFENRQNLENKPVFGGRIGFNFSRYFGIEGTGEFIKTNVDNKSTKFTKEGQFTSPIDSVKIYFYHLDLVYHLIPEGRFNPFIVAGYGAGHYNPRINNKNMSVVDFGVGAKYWLADHVALRLDLRDNMVWDEKIHNLAATLGVVFAFGGSGKAAPAPVAKYEPAPKAMPVAQPTAKPMVPEKVVIIASEPKAEEKVLTATMQPKIVILAFEDIHFDFDQSTLKPEAKQILKRNIQILKANPEAQIHIAGYTSASGTGDYNQKLSERRASAVMAYLVDEGIIAPERLATIGYGEANPAAYEAAPTELYSPAAKANMRVLFEIVVR